MSRLPLRIQLPAIAITLLLVSQLVIGVVALALVQRTLVDQVDRRLHDAAIALNDRRPASEEGQGVVQRIRLAELPSEYVVMYHNVQGFLVERVASELRDRPEPPAVEVQFDTVGPYTVRADGEFARWRMVTIEMPQARGTLTVALPLSDVTDATAGLRRTLIIVLVGTAAVGGLVAWAATRRSLRPLREAEATAAAIAGGDLNHRVPASPAGTEAGALAASLNAMLERLDSAFTAQHDSEDRLRSFLADASHELRTPLAAIQGYAELHRLGSGQDPDQAMTRIESNALRMGALVEDLLTLARYDERPASLGGSERLNLADLAEEAAADLRAQAPDRTIKVTTHTDQQSPVATGSSRHVKQVLANVCGNALQHTPAGTRIDLVVSTDAAAKRASVTIRDQGPGIPKAERDKVFSRFHRVDVSRTRETGGSGLGLAIVEAVMRAHGGTARAIPPADGGATIVLEFPLAN